MSRVKEVHYTVSVTVNLGNYESAKVELAEYIELESGDNVDTEKKELIKRVTARAETEARRIKEKIIKDRGV